MQNVRRRSMLRTAPVEPVDPHGTCVLGVGSALWGIALIGTLFFRQQLVAAGHGSWPWICLAGVLVGLAGVGVFARMERRAARRK